MFDNPIKRLLSLNPTFLVLDGALGTQLELLGGNTENPLWASRLLLDEPQKIKSLHLEYLRSGANIITTSTYQATFEGFKKAGLSSRRAEEMFNLSLDLANEARDEFVEENSLPKKNILIAASIGSYGSFLGDRSEYDGNYGLSEKELIEFHEPRVNFFASVKNKNHDAFDILAFETIPSKREVKAILCILKRVDLIPAWISFSLKNPDQLCDGSSWLEMIPLLEELPSVVAVGANCIPLDWVDPFLKKLNIHTQIPSIVYPKWLDHEGFPFSACSSQQDESKEFLGRLPFWLDLGAKIIGGCCGTSPRLVSSLFKHLNTRL